MSYYFGIIFEIVEPPLVAKHVFLHKIVILGKGQAPYEEKLTPRGTNNNLTFISEHN